MMEYQDQPADPTAYLPPRQGEAIIRAKDIRANLHQDVHTAMVADGMTDTTWASIEDVVDQVVDNAMFQIEHLLVEIEALHIKDRAMNTPLCSPNRASVDRTEWHRD
jgi:hypothetical protein